MDSHHAYLYEGPASLLPELADAACARFDFIREHNPDVVIEAWEKFGIDEARELSQQASLKSTSGRSLFVLGLSSITNEAQQALLKLFEEPVAGAVFVVLVPHGTLIPTLRSRFLEYPEKDFARKSSASLQVTGERSAESFLASPYAKRSAWVTAFMKDEEGLRERTRNFLNELERILHTKIEDPEVREGLADIAHFREYLSDRSPSLKMILEHFAATLPTLK
jgi:phytoene dehydrogenase-like protein